MKSLTFRLFLSTFLMIIVQSCGEDVVDPTPTLTPEQIAVEGLTDSGSQTWIIAGGGSVIRDGITVTDIYANFELVMNSGSFKTYSSKNNNDLFDLTGSWDFTGSNFDKFILSGSKPAAEREISFTQTEDSLILNFTIPAPGAKLNGVLAVAGSYTFHLLKQ